MKSSYKWGWQIIQQGYLSLTTDQLTPEEIDKRWYVAQFLYPSVHEAGCGWHGVSYCVCDGNGDRREFVLMYGDKETTPKGARWIDVTGNSKGAISEAVWSLVFD